MQHGVVQCVGAVRNSPPSPRKRQGGPGANGGPPLRMPNLNFIFFKKMVYEILPTHTVAGLIAVLVPLALATTPPPAEARDGVYAVRAVRVVFA